jgi:mRNA-degrading endonuclease RelE of RelBE toxin-antitoxin system
MPYNPLVFSFIETKLFTRLVLEYLTDDEYQELQTTLIERPRAGQVIPGTGGVRKLRWRATGRGKRGGYRVIYYARIEHGAIWMLTMYPKNVKDNIPAQVLRQIRDEVEDGQENP